MRSSTNKLARKKLDEGSVLSGPLLNGKYRKSEKLRRALADQPCGSFARSHGWRGDLNYRWKKLKKSKVQKEIDRWDDNQTLGGYSDK